MVFGHREGYPSSWVLPELGVSSLTTHSALFRAQTQFNFEDKKNWSKVSIFKSKSIKIWPKRCEAYHSKHQTS